MTRKCTGSGRKSGLVLILALLIAGMTFAGSASAEPVKGKKRSSHQLKAKSHKKFHKTRHKKHRRVPASQSLALLRQYLPEFSDIDKTKQENEGDKSVAFPVGFDFRSPYAVPALRYKLVTNINRWLGTRYRYGGSGKRGIDCSGFTSVVISSTIGESFYGPAHVQARKVERVEFDELQFGDLLFFTGRNRKSDRIGHVGIYLGNGLFAHSSTFRGVIYSHITEGYYSERFRFGGRIISASFADTHRLTSDKL